MEHNTSQEEPDQLTDIEENAFLQEQYNPPNKKPSELSKANKIIILAVILVVVTIICSYFLVPKPYSKLFVGLEKPGIDGRRYKAIELSNEMKVLLISDTESELAGVSVDVGVGTWNEPDNLPGLAHFLEHMLFMGSKKYPNVSEFGDFISQNGGSYNAQTGSQNTNYYFMVSGSALEKAMDIFSR